MTPEQWARVTGLFDEARMRPSEERRGFVEQACPDDAVVRAEVLALLEVDREDAFLEGGARVQPRDLLDADGGHRLAEGESIGPYRIERLLARGGMGVIYLAADTRLGRPVTLKVLPAALARDPRARTRLQREARTAALLRHPHVVSVHALEDVGTSLAIVAEYVAGPTLQQVIATDGPLPRGAWWATATALAAALNAAHAAGVVHRDVKTSNVVMGADGLRLVDFGIALADVDGSATRVTQAGQLTGTPLAFAPEQLEGGTASPLSDQFAYGLVLYEAASGRLPFGDGPIAAVWARMLRDEPTPLATLAPQLGADDIALVHRCLARRPEDRFPSMRDVEIALAALPPVDTAPSARVSGLVEAVPATSRAPATSDNPQRWLDIHQASTAALYLGLLWPGWLTASTLPGRWRAATLMALVCLAAVATSVRLHLWFSVRQYPEAIASDRRRLWPVLAGIDVGYALVLLLAAVAAADTTLVPALVSAGLAMCLLVASLVIEPATRRASLPD